MAGAEPTGLDMLLHRLGQTEKAEHVGDMAAALADRLRQILLSVAELLHEAPIAFGLLKRGQILALDVLDKRDLQRLVIGELADDDRNLVQLGDLRRAPASLAGDDLIGIGGVGMATHQQRLQYPLLADRRGKRMERLVIEAPARLEAAWP